MKRATRGLVLFFGILFTAIMSGCSGSPEVVDYVDPSIGAVGHILQPTRPTVQIPNQMIRMYPDRNDHLDDRIRSFPLTLISHRNGVLYGVMPYVGEDVKRDPISAWDEENEISTPYYYQVWLEDYDVTVDYAPGKKVGYFRFNYPNNVVKSLRLKNRHNGQWVQVDERTVKGVESFSGMKAYVYGQFSVAGTFISDKNRDREEATIRWDKEADSVIDFKYAISFISDEQAKANFDDEIARVSFDALKDSAEGEWAKMLGQIEVEGGTEARRRTFYTALYRCYERMMDVTEGDRYYSNYDKKVHEADRPFYVDDWVWDTYLAHHPLRAILDPDREADMVASYVRMYEQSGWLPQFPILWGDNPCMNGFHSSIVILDCYRKGIRNFDIDTAYEAMLKNAKEATMLPWKNGPACDLDRFYWENGYYPALRPGEKETEPMVHGFEKRQAVAITLGHSYDDWALSQMAGELGDEEVQDVFGKRASNYKNLYWKEKGFFMPKHADGQWIDIDPKFAGGMGGRDYYDENNGWTYLWQVQHDVAGLMELMGGKERFEARLDQLFREGLGRSKYDTWARFPDFTGIVGQFSMGNEPSFHIPYLYNFTDSPWKTQKKIRMLLNTWYPDNIWGIPGDEDGGGMTAFVVFSSMGFYPVVPGLPMYTIGSPVFEKITIHLDNGNTFTVAAPGCSERNKYVQAAYLNGKKLDGLWFTHEDLMNGGELRLLMGQKPNKAWGVGSTLFEELSAKYVK